MLDYTVTAKHSICLTATTSRQQLADPSLDNGLDNHILGSILRSY